jgi:hypothetical protein
MSELEILSRYPELLGKLRELGGGANVYIGPDDSLAIESRGALPQLWLQIAGRLLTPEGEIVPFLFFHRPTSDRSVSFDTFTLREGYLLNVEVVGSGGANPPRSCWVKLWIVRGGRTVATGIAVLAEGYVDSTSSLTWPGGKFEPGFSGMGRLRVIVGTQPAAGQEISETVPTGAIWRVHSITFTLTTSATVADRWVNIIGRSGTNVAMRSIAAASTPASTSNQYSAFAGGVRASAAGVVSMVLPSLGLLLYSGWAIGTGTTGLQAGDQFSAPVLEVEEWITG